MSDSAAMIDYEAVRALVPFIEKADGPDRELDGDIAVALGFFPENVVRRMSAIDGGSFATNAHTSWKAPAYTGSLDAAVALVERLSFQWSKSMDGFVDVSNPTTGTTVQPRCATVMLSLVAGVLMTLLGPHPGKPPPKGSEEEPRRS